MSTKYVRIVQSSEAPGSSLSGEVARAFDRIRERAYEIYDNRSPEAPGSEFEDWLRAERELFEVPEVNFEEESVSGRFRVVMAAESSPDRPITILVEPAQLTALGHSMANGELRLFRIVSLPEPIDAARSVVTAIPGEGIVIGLARAGSAEDHMRIQPKAKAAAAAGAASEYPAAAAAVA